MENLHRKENNTLYMTKLCLGWLLIHVLRPHMLWREENQNVHIVHNILVIVCINDIIYIIIILDPAVCLPENAKMYIKFGILVTCHDFLFVVKMEKLNGIFIFIIKLLKIHQSSTNLFCFAKMFIIRLTLTLNVHLL